MNHWLLKGLGGLLVLSPVLSVAEAPKPQSMYFDPILGKLVPSQTQPAMSSRELLLQVNIKQIILGELLVIEEQGQYWVDLAELLELFDFPIQYSPPLSVTQETEKKPFPLTAQGWFIRESNQFGLKTLDQSDPLVYEINSNDQVFRLTQDQLLIRNQSIYFPLDQVLAWFEMAFEINPNTLTLDLDSAQTLPIEAKIRRKNRTLSSLYSDFEVQFPRQDVPYQAFSPVFSDIQLNARHSNSSLNRYGVSVLGAGDLAYMTGRYYLSHSKTESVDASTNLSLSLERNSVQSDLLGPLKASHVSLGDISPASVSNIPNSGSQVGVRFSNRPFGRVTNSSTTSITGLQQAGWDVELYQNNILVAAQTIDDNGQYQFLDQRLEVGENIFILKFYGPQGQLEERSESYVLDPSSLTGGGLIYDVSFTREQWSLSDFFDSDKEGADDRYRVNLHLEKSLNPSVSLTTDISQFEFSDGSQHVFIQPGLRAFAWDTVFSATVLKDVEAGQRATFGASRSFGVAKKHKLSFGLTSSSEDFQIDAGREGSVELTRSMNLSGPVLDGRGLRMNYQLGAGISDYFDGRQAQSFSFDLGANFRGVRFGHNLAYDTTKTLDSEKNDNLDGAISISGRVKRVYLRGAYQYKLKPESEPIAASLSASWNLMPNLSTQWRYGYDYETDSLSQSYDFTWAHSSFMTSLGVQKNQGTLSGRLNFRFSLGHDPIKNEIFVSGKRLSQTAAVSALVFEDLNNNQRLDADEPMIENAKVMAVQQRRNSVTDDKGAALITGLYASTPTDIGVDETSLEDPFWVPSREGISFLPRPGLVKTILIPVVSAGEVEGGIKLATELFAEPLDLENVPLVLTNAETGAVYKTRSQFDGYFLFNKVKPGQYSLTVAPEFLEKNQLETRQPMPISIGARGTLILGANFQLFPAGMYQPDKTQTPQDGVSYSVDLGSFVSEKNAQMVLTVLRTVFPDILSKLQMGAPVEMLMTKQAQDYQLVLGPFNDVNPAKELCGELIKEDLHCQIQKHQTSLENGKAPPADETPALIRENDHINLVAEPTEVKKSAELAEVRENVAVDRPMVEAALPQVERPEGLTTYSIQLLSVQNRANIEAYVQKNDLKNTQIFITNKQGKRFYSLTVGLYATKQAALEDAKVLGEQLGLKPWVRALESFDPL